jgi:hypothetical protein
MSEDNKRWLISRMKTSGSKRRYVDEGDYADDRHKKRGAPEFLPTHESFKSSSKFYNGKIRYGLLVRFSRGNIGKDWDDVHHEILSRIPTKLFPHKEIIYWFVADKIEFVDGMPWDKSEQKFLQLTNEPYSFAKIFKEFYVNPETNKLMHNSK